MANPPSQFKGVEISVAMAGPFRGMMLRDYGADVIKIERVGHGDDSRAWPPNFHGGMSHYFASADRNKKSVALDLKDPEGVEVVKRLIPDADVVIDNDRYGALVRAGLDNCYVITNANMDDADEKRPASFSRTSTDRAISREGTRTGEHIIGSQDKKKASAQEVGLARPQCRQ